MIGWRPYLLTALAVVLVAVAILDVHASLRRPSACATADSLRAGQLLDQARNEYASVLRAHPAAACATAGLVKTTAAQCEKAQAIASFEPAEARTELVALAAADPSPPARSCVWDQLRTLALAATVK
jgi:hypothetical protein